MSINLDEKINLIHEFIYNNLNNCYDIDNININKLELDDIRIPIGKIQEDLYKQITTLSKIQFNFEDNNNLYFNIYTDGFPYLLKLSSESIDKSNNDSLISYILSEIVLKYKLCVLLPILNIDIQVNSLEKFLKIKSNDFYNNILENKKKRIIQLKIRENFNKHHKSNNYDINWKVFLFLILYTLIQIKKSFNEFKHNDLRLDNIFIEEKTNNIHYVINDIKYTLPDTTFFPKITNFEKSFISNKISKNINNNLDDTLDDIDVDNKTLSQDDFMVLCKDILKLNNNLNLETKKFLNYVIELNNMNYEKLVNNEYFDEFKSNNNILTKLKNSNESMLGNQKNLLNVYASNRKLKDESNKKLKDESNKKLNDESNRKLKDESNRKLKDESNNSYTSNRKLKVSFDDKNTQKKQDVLNIYTSNRKLKNTNELLGGFDKNITPSSRSEKNTPFLTNDERSTYRKRSNENPPREPAVLLEQTIYDTSKSKAPIQQPPPAYIPVYDELGSAVATIPSFNNLTAPNPAYSQPFQKVYNISMSNPLTHYTSINRVFEDIIPGDPRSLSFNTIYERIQLKNFMRNIILDNVDGEEMCINGGKNSILSYIKLMEINPYSLKQNPYEDLAQNFLLFRAAYPIRYDNQKHNLEIAKDSVGLNIRLYNMSIGELRAETINKHINKFEFDLWREIEYYRFIRDEVLLKKLSPNFASMILYKVDSKSVIDWKQLSIGKNTINYSNSYKINELHDLKEFNKIINQSKTKQKSPVNLFWINTVNPNNNTNNFWLDIEETLKNNSDFNLKWLDPTKVEFQDFLNKNKITKYPSILIEHNSRFINYNGDKNIHDLLNYLNNEILNTNKLDLTISAGRTLILMTEAPNTNIIKWASPIYEGYGSQVKMKATGYRTSEIWKSVIFQILYILTILQEKDIYFRELSLENNFYIKDLFYDHSNVKYWIYTIDNVDYYVPNYGYIVIFDSKYSDITSPETVDLNKREFKICSTKLFNNNGSFNSNKIYFMNQLKEIINQTNFTNKLKNLGAHPIDDVNILKLIDNIFINIHTNIKDLFIIHFKEYLHNKIGTLLMTSEKDIITSLNISNLKKGQIVVWRERYDQYKWVLYKEKDNNSTNKHIIIIKNNNNYIEASVHQNTLLGYPPNEKITLNSITDQQIIEKYIL